MSNYCPKCGEEIIDEVNISCENPDCKESRFFVPFLIIPNKSEFRYVNNGDEDVCIRYYWKGASFEELTILRMAGCYGWFIYGEDDEEGTSWEIPADEKLPRMFFPTVKAAIEDARAFLKLFPPSDISRNAIQLLEEFERANQGGN